MCERRFTNHAVRPKTDAIYTTSRGDSKTLPNNRTAKVLLFAKKHVGKSHLYLIFKNI